MKDSQLLMGIAALFFLAGVVIGAMITTIAYKPEKRIIHEALQSQVIIYHPVTGKYVLNEK